MDGKELLKFLNGIGVPINCNLNPDSLDVYMKNKSSRSFVVGMCRTLGDNNLLQENEYEKEIEMMSQEEKDPRNTVFQTNINLDELLANVNNLEDHIKSLEQKNEILKSSLENKSKKVSDKKKLVKKLNGKLCDQLSECKELGAQLKKESFLLTQDYSQLYHLICDQNPDPPLLFQLPLHSYKVDKQACETHIKSFIIKQFEERTAELAGQNVITTCRQQNPRELHHLVSGPEKELYKQQLIELEHLQICLAESLYVNSIQEAKILGLEHGIKKAKLYTSGNKGLNTRYGREDNISVLEERIHSAATDNVARRLGVMVTGNYIVKQKRQHYYLEKLNILEGLLQNQLALDKLLCAILQIEGNMTEKARNFIVTSQDCMNETAHKAIFNMSNMHSFKDKSTWGNKNEVTQLGHVMLELFAEFEATKISENAMKTKSICNATHHLQNLLQNVELQILQENSIFIQCVNRVQIRDEVCKLLLNSTVVKDEMMQSDPQFETFKHQTDKELTKFNLDRKRQEKCANLTSLRNLWAKFVAHPELLSKDWHM